MSASRAGWLVAGMAFAAWVAACGHEWSGPGDASDVDSGADDGVVPPDGADADGDADADADADADGDADGGCPAPQLDCGGTCIDPTNDLANCGECWWVCDPPNGTGSCSAGECSVTCAPGWIDANGTSVDGCEYFCTPSAGWETIGATCTNGLDDDCDTRTDGSDPDCASCVPEFCNLADDDCDGLVDEDFDLDFDPLNCGACGNACPRRPHAAPACVLGLCDVVCAPGWSDADGDPRNGCEAACVPSPTSDETSCNGADDDCDGSTDEDWSSTVTCGYSSCVRNEICNRGEVSCRPRTAPSSDDTTCDGIDDDCDGATDEEASCGCTGDAECDDSNPCTIDDCGSDLLCHISPAADGTACPTGRCCSRACVDDTSELCNGIDDDCDGSVDEGYACRAGQDVSCTTSCGSAGSGRCTGSCAVPTGSECFPPAETCNGVDDDCDGTCDDGFGCCRGQVRDCTTGAGATGVQSCGSDCSWGTCTATTDPCNGIDDDGDTRCDSAFECCRGATESRACTCGGTEARTCGSTCTWGTFGGCWSGDCLPGSNESCATSCGSTGIRFCEASCSWGGCVPPAETCDGIDNDCDGSTDEGYGCRLGEAQSCTTACATAGTRTCGPGCTWGPCSAGAETCNGVDDDCDGSTDEGWTCPAGAAGSCTTTCGSTGTHTCSASCSWGVCSPPTETCNGVDDDCDGSTDEGWTCPAGSTSSCTNSCGGSGTRTCDSSCGWGACLPAGSIVTCYVCAEDPAYLPSSSPYCGDLSLTSCSLTRSVRVGDDACVDTVDSWRRTYCCP
jgi:hypothetical protein